MLTNDIEFRTIKPRPELSDFVESFWMLANHSTTEHEVVVLPDGRFDIIFSYAAGKPYEPILRGLDTQPDKNAIPPKTVMFAISFRLLAIEYLLDIKASALLNEGVALPYDFWGMAVHDLDDFDSFCNKVSGKMLSFIKHEIDTRKQELFELIYSSKGSLSVKELSGKVFWSSRQINRYFKAQFGISPKAYCNILRFRESLQHIKDGKLFPELNFTDQNHFIKEIKKFSGVVPKVLFKNQNDRFILLSALPSK